LCRFREILRAVYTLQRHVIYNIRGWSIIVQSERSSHDTDTLGYIGTQSGMFSLLPITAEQERALTRDHGIHVVQGGRVNVARLKLDNISTLINATHDVLGL